MSNFIKCVLRLFIVLFMACGFSHQGQAFDYFITDPDTGYAIHGYDPVAYFDKNQALLGLEGFESEWSDAYWKFINAANQERFLESPHIYSPRFNGYGAFSVANGRLSEGNPLIWAIYKDRLMFFHSINARQQWAENPEKFTQNAKENWKHLRTTLTR